MQITVINIYAAIKWPQQNRTEPWVWFQHRLSVDSAHTESQTRRKILKQNELWKIGAVVQGVFYY